jgi:hypothetical protein
LEVISSKVDDLQPEDCLKKNSKLLDILFGPIRALENLVQNSNMIVLIFGNLNNEAKISNDSKKTLKNDFFFFFFFFFWLKQCS